MSDDPKPTPQNCGLCGAFLPRAVPGVIYRCGKCGTQFENTTTDGAGR